MSPLPGYKVIPDGWAEHHRPVANSTMTEEAVIYRSVAGPPPYPLPPGWLPEYPVLTTKARVQELKRENAPVPGEQPSQVRSYLVTIPIVGAPPLKAGESGDTVVVLGRRYRILQIMEGTLLWELDLICSSNITQQDPLEVPNV